MTIKSLSTPLIGEAGLKRLLAFCRAAPLTSTSTLFDAGYEQAKRDFLTRLEAEVGKPTNRDPMLDRDVSTDEARLRRSSTEETGWWRRLVG